MKHILSLHTVRLFRPSGLNALVLLVTYLLCAGSLKAQAPQIVSLDPLNGTTTYPGNGWIFVVEFDEDVSASSLGFVSVKVADGDNTVESRRATETSHVTVQNNVVIIDFDPTDVLRDLVNGTEYYLEIDGNAFDDLDGNSFAGLGEGDWNFTVRSHEFPPSIQSLTPANGGIVEKNDPLTIMFDEPIQIADSRQEITITELGGRGTRLSVPLDEVSVLGSKVIIPDQDLTHNTTYYVTISNSAFQDYSRNAFAGISSNETWRFTAEDQIDPSLVSLSPINGGTNVDISPTLVATFDEPMAYAQVNANFQLREVGDNSFVYSWTVNPPSDIFSDYVSISGNQILFEVPVALDFNTEYKFLGHYVADENGNETITAWTTWEFTTRLPSVENDIISMTFPGIVGNAIINTTDHTVTATAEATVSSRFDIPPTIGLSDGATGRFLSNPPTFQNGVPVNYNVNAESGAFQQWQITISWEEMEGSYTVGDNGTFETLTDAISQIAHAGMSDDVMLEVEDGYNVRKTVFLSNPDPTHNITIRPQAGASQIDLYPESNFGSVFRVNSAISNMVIDGADPSTGNIVMNVNSDIANVEGVNFFGSGDYDFTLKNLRFNVLEGAAVQTNTGTLEISGIDIIGCEFVAVNTESTVNITGISMRRNNHSDIDIIGNRFFNDDQAPEPASYNAIVAPFDFLTNIHNNSISIRGAQCTGVGRGTNILHNSIRIYGTGSETSGSHYAIGFGTNIKNNLISIERTSGSGTTKEFVAFSTLQSADSDNNVYISDDGNSTVEYAPNAIDQASLFTLVPTTTFVQASFLNAVDADLALVGDSEDDKDLRADPLAEVTDDINGDTRSLNLATKGAFESPNRFTEILTFSFPEETGTATIDDQNGTIAIEVAVGTDLSALTPTITIVQGATINPLSNEEQDFSTPFAYTVTAEDGLTTQTYTVNVTRLINTDANITSWTMDGIIGDVTIDNTTNSVEMTVDGLAGFGAAGSIQTYKFNPTVELSFGASISPTPGINSTHAPGQIRTYTVTAEDGTSTEEWAVVVNYQTIPGGVYSIGTGGDFESIATAFRRLTDIGVNGDITLEVLENQTVSSAQLNEREDLLGHTLTIQPADGVTDLLFSQSTSAQSLSMNWQKVIFDGKNVTKIENRSRGTVLSLSNSNEDPDEFAIIKNLTVEGRSTSTIDNTTIENCEFIVEDNSNISLWAFSLAGSNSLIRNNKVHFGSVIDQPAMTLLGFSIFDGEIYNNFIQLNPTNVSGITGIQYRSLIESAAYHNTISIEGTSVNNETLRGIYDGGASTGNTLIQNNLISITRDPGAGGSITGYTIRVNSTSEPIHTNNNYYLESNGGSLIYVDDKGTTYDESNFTTLQSLVEGTTRSQPVFTDIANNDLTLTGASLDDADLRGTPIASVPTDFFGASRSAFAPSKGAHEVPNNQTDILSFTLPEETGPATIDPSGGTVTIEVPFSTAVTSLTPTIGVSPGATVDPDSEVARDFTNPVTYDVFPESGDNESWMVTVTKAPARTDTDITAFSITGHPDTPVIDVDNYTVSYDVAFGTDLTALVPVIEVSGGATISPVSGEPNDFTTPQVYTVTAEDVSVTQDWTITVNLANVDPSDIALSPTDIDENQPVGTVVGDITGTDPNGDDLTFTLVSGLGSTHNTLFFIDPSTDELKTSIVFDFELGVSTFFIRIKADDMEGGSREETFEIALNDLDDTPPALVSRSPEDIAGPVNAAVDTDITITFDEDIVSNLNTSNQIRLALASGPLVEAFTDNSRVSITDETIIIDPTDDLDPGTEYEVIVQAGALLDRVGNGITPFSWTFTTTKLDQTITFDEFGPVTFGDDNITLPQFTDANLIIAYESDDLSVASVTNNTLTIIGAGTANITASQPGNSQYNEATPIEREIVIDPAGVDITLAANTTVTYNGSSQGVDASALDLNDNPLALLVEYSEQGEDDFSETAPTNVGSYDIRASVDPSITNYTASMATGVLTISPRGVDVNVDAGQSKVYGQSDPAFTFTALPALESGDSFSGSLTRTGGENVGNYTITQGSLTAGGNYTITFNSADFSITQRGVTVNVEAGQSKVYGQEDPAGLNFVAVPALEDGDDFSGELEREIGENIGDYSINQGSLTAGGNYIITYNSADFAITPRGVTVNVDASQMKVYGQSDPASFTFVAIPALEMGDNFSGSLERVAGENVGNYAINQGDLTAGSNYVITFNSEDFTITPRNVSVDATVGLTKVFGDNDPELTFTASPPLEDGDSFSGNLERDAGDDVGTYNINQGGLTAGLNYTIDYDGSEFSITPRSVSIDLNPNTQVTFDGGPQVVTPTALDLDNNPLGLLIEYSPQGDDNFSSTAPINAGTYDVRVQLDGSDNNYQALSATGLLTIDKATAAITLSDLEQVFDGTPRAVSVMTDPTGLTVDITYDGSTTVPVNADSYPIVATIDDANYEGTANGTLIISRADQVITFNPAMIEDKLISDTDPISIEATSNSGLTVMLDIEGPASLSMGMITLDGTQGTVTITANQEGSENYNEVTAELSFLVISPNVAPTDISLGNSNITENNEAKTLIGSFTTTDGNTTDSHTYSLVAGEGDTDNASFSIDNDQLLAEEIFDFEAQSTYSVRVRTDDGRGETFDKTFAITIVDGNDAPTIAMGLDNETRDEGFNSFQVSLSGIFSDQDGDNLQFSAVSSNAEVATVSVASTELTVAEVGVGVSTITVTVSDGNGGTVTGEFTITINSNPINNAPTVVNALEDQVVDVGFGSIILDLSSTFTDADGDNLTLTASSSDTNIASVEISGTSLTITEVGTGTVTITVTADDGNGVPVSEQIQVTINVVTGIADEILAQVQVYPNPSTEFFQVDLPSGDWSAQVISPAGQVRLTLDRLQSSQRVEVAGWTPGVYFLRLFNENNSATTIKLSIR